MDQLDSIHAAWRLKKPKSTSPVPGKKVGGIAVATASVDGSHGTSGARSRSPESTSPLRDQGIGMGPKGHSPVQGRGHEEGKGEEGDKRVGGGVRGREGQSSGSVSDVSVNMRGMAVTEEVGAEEQKEEETQRTVRWNHGGKGTLQCTILYVIQYYAMSYYTILSYTILSYSILCYLILCYVMLYYTIL